MTDVLKIVGELVKRLETASPEERLALQRQIEQLPAEARELMNVHVRGQLVSVLPVGLDGFKHYYFCKHKRELPPHAEVWVKALLEAHFDETGVMIEGFRGSTKSTVTATMVEYLSGKYPERSSLIICSTESDAKKMAQYIADTVESNAGWKVCFPNVIPDKDRGWGAEGYHLKDSKVPYQEWVQRVMSDHGRDPSFLAVSVTSGAVGKHPTLCLFLDDIHNQKNTASKAERMSVVNTVKADILPVMSRAKPRPFVAFTFTPWDEEDTYAEMKRTGIFKQVKTPVYTENEKGKFTYEGRKVDLAWQEVFTVDEIKKWRQLVGSSEFARMFLCDLKKAGVTLFKYYSYPHEQINPSWIRAGGVDYASIQMPTRQSLGNRSHFALALGTKTPQNTICLVDGVVAQCTQADAEGYVLRYQENSISYRYTALETNGKGEEFYNLMRRNPRAKVFPHQVKGKKSDRLYRELSPLLENGMLLVSDADTPFLNAFRTFLDKFPNIDEHDKEWDVADSVYHMVSCFPECLAIPAQPQENLTVRKDKKVSPWVSVGA